MSIAGYACLRSRRVGDHAARDDERPRLGIRDRWQAFAADGLVVHRAPGGHESYFKVLGRP
jgi:hypothetical protein